MSYLDDRADLKGRVAVIVGGGGGLGRACAIDLAGAGMRLALCDRDVASLGETAALIAEAGGEVITGELDARDADALTAFFADVDARYGTTCDVLINVVGGTFRQPFEESNARGLGRADQDEFHLAAPFDPAGGGAHADRRGAASSTSPRSKPTGLPLASLSTPR